MIKKRHLMILSLAIVSVLLGSLFYNNQVLGTGKPTTDVNVVNLPLDEEGNLRVSQMDGEQNVTVTNFPLDEEGNFKVKVVDTPLQICTDAVEITVLDWTAMEYYDLSAQATYDIGLYFDREFPLDFPFVFTPKGSLLNITRLWISVVLISKWGYGVTDFKVKFNDNFTISFDEIAVNRELLGSHTRHLEFDPVLNAINSGINVLQLYGSPDPHLHIYRINIFIEYQYLA